MRVVGYVRDAPGPSESEPAFAQSERVRTWVHDSGHQLVAMCQDVRTPGHSLGRDGYRALIGIVESGEAEGVVLPDLTALSPDKITQEIMLWDLQNRGVTVLSTSRDDVGALTNPPHEQIRLIVRDVLAKVATHHEQVGSEPPPGLIDLTDATLDVDSDVIIELIPPGRERTRGGRVSPVQ